MADKIREIGNRCLRGRSHERKILQGKSFRITSDFDTSRNTCIKKATRI